MVGGVVSRNSLGKQELPEAVAQSAPRTAHRAPRIAHRASRTAHRASTNQSIGFNPATIVTQEATCPACEGHGYIVTDGHAAITTYFADAGICNSFYWAWNPDSHDIGGVLEADWQTPHPEKVRMLQAYWQRCSR